MKSKFKPLLATEAKLEKLRYPVLVSPKLDGIRAFVLNGKLLCRSLKPVPNNHIRETIEALGSELEGLDGEIIVGSPTASDCFNVTTSAVMSADGEPDFTFVVFDKIADGSYVDRFISKIIHIDIPFVEVVDNYTANDEGLLMAIEDHLVNAGYEGAMIRSPDGIYKNGRSTANEGILLKLKRFKDSEAVIVGFEERMHNANKAKINDLGYTERSSHKDNKVPMDTLGSLVVECPDFESSFKIGTGFDDITRQSIWDSRDLAMGDTVKFKYQPVGVKDKPRFPVFLGFRDIRDL